MKEPVFPEGVVTVDRTSNVPLTEQIYRSIREAVRKDLVEAGTKLPSSRRFSEALGVGRNTVTSAYELLQAEGIITVTVGAAPRISEELKLEGQGSSSIAASIEPKLSARGIVFSDNLRGDGWATHHGALQPGAPALDCFPYEDWARCLRRAARSERSVNVLYQNYTGLPLLKEKLASHLSRERGVRPDPDQILVLPSMQASLSLLAQALADPGDTAWLEEPGYLGARTAFHLAGMTIRPLPVDHDGADVSKMRGETENPRLIYVTPSHHYPFGTRMPLARRLSLLEAARASGAVILEDDYDSEFLFSGRPVAALCGLAEEGQVIYLGTFSKSLLPGLHIAYCVVPKTLIDPLSQLMRNMGAAANVQAQAALAMFMEGGGYQKHLKNIRTLYEERGTRLVTALRSKLGNRISVEQPSGNVQIAMLFNETRDDVHLALEMQKSGFALSPLSRCYLGEPKKSGLIIGFSGATDKQIETGVNRLSQLLA